MRQSTLDKAKKAVELTKKGVSMKQAAKAVGMDMRTLKKSLAKLALKRIRKHGRIFILTDYVKSVVDGVIYYMMGGQSATAACVLAHTTLPTAKRMKVVVKGRKRALLKKPPGKKHCCYKLNVVRLTKIQLVFYGTFTPPAYKKNGDKSKATHAGNGDSFGIKAEEEAYVEPIKDYAALLWQYDVDKFTTSLKPIDAVAHYPKDVLKHVSKNVEPHIDKFFPNYHLTFTKECYCGYDDRHDTEEYLTPAEYLLRRVAKDMGKFVIIIRRNRNSFRYPPNGYSFEFEHDTLEPGVKRK